MKQTNREVSGLRGCERRIYYVKNAQSPYFEEAYLVLRPGGMKRSGGEGSDAKTLAEEAERIIRESAGRYGGRKKHRPPIFRLTPPLAFALGAGASSAFIGSVLLIVALL